MLMPDLKDTKKSALREKSNDLDKHFRVVLQLCSWSIA